MKGLRKIFFTFSVALLIGIFTMSQVCYATGFVSDLRTARTPETIEKQDVDDIFNLSKKTVSVGNDHTVEVTLLPRPFLLGQEPATNSPIVTETGLSTDTAITIAAGLKVEGWVGKADPTKIDMLGEAGKEAKVLGKEMDRRAHELQKAAIHASGNRVHHMGMEGESDGLSKKDLFEAGEIVNPDGTQGDEFMISDEIDGTTDTVTNNNGEPFEERNEWFPGGISLQVTGDVVQKRGLGSDSFYKAGLFFNVPAGKREDFKNNIIDPDIPDDLEGAKEYMKRALTRIASANDLSLKDVEVALMRRGREKFTKKVLDEIGVELHDFKDGTPGHAALANLKPDKKKVRVYWSIAKSTEQGWNEAVADALYQAGYGAIGYTKIYSKEVNYAANKEESSDMKRRYIWTEEVKKEIQEKYPKDSKDILAGKRVFVTGEIEGTVDASMLIITDNRLFNQRGMGELQKDGTIEVPELRIKGVREEGKWKCYTFMTKRKVNYRNYCLEALINAPEEMDAIWMKTLGVDRASITSEEKEWLSVLLGLKGKGQKTVKGRKIDSVIDGVLQGRLVLALDNDKAKIENVFFVQATSVPMLLERLKGVLALSARGEVRIIDEARLRSDVIDYLGRECTLNKNEDVRKSAQYIVREAGLQLGLKPASLHDFYMARNEGKWSNLTVPTFNIRAGVYDEARRIFRKVIDSNVGIFGFELARTETRYTGQRPGEYLAVCIAAGIKEGYSGPVFGIGDHYQVNKDKYFAGGAAREQELDAIESMIREAILGGNYNIDLDPSTLIDQEVLEEILAFEGRFVDAHLKDHPELLEGLDKPGIEALRYKLVDELELSPKDTIYLDGLYQTMHRTTTKVTMDLIAYIRGLQRELLDDKITIGIGIEERHIDKKMPSSVRGSITLAKNILEICERAEFVQPCKIALQTGTMHGVGGKIDFGVFERHQDREDEIGIHIFVQHGTSTIKDRQDFAKLPKAGVGEAHLATEYQKIHLGIIAKMMPALAEEMGQFMEKLMDEDAKYDKKFRAKWNAAFNSKIQQEKSRHQIIVEILSDTLPDEETELTGKDKKLKGSLKDLAKEVSGPFKDNIWNVPAHVQKAIDRALAKEFSFVMDSLGVSDTKGLVESIIPTKDMPEMHGVVPKTLDLVLSRTVLHGGRNLGTIAKALQSTSYTQAHNLDAEFNKLREEFLELNKIGALADELDGYLEISKKTELEIKPRNVDSGIEKVLSTIGLNRVQSEQDIIVLPGFDMIDVDTMERLYEFLRSPELSGKAVVIVFESKKQLERITIDFFGVTGQELGSLAWLKNLENLTEEDKAHLSGLYIQQGLTIECTLDKLGDKALADAIKRGI